MTRMLLLKNSMLRRQCLAAPSMLLTLDGEKLSILPGLTWGLGILSLALIIVIILPRLRNRKKTKSEQPSIEEVPVSSQKLPSEMNNEELFQYLSEVIRREELFLNPLLDRQALIDRSGLSAHRIGAAFSKGSEYRSLPGYIRKLRLEHARSLLISRPDLSVKSVGEMSGFSNNSTFCSDFKNHFGITPSDYRQEILSQSS